MKKNQWLLINKDGSFQFTDPMGGFEKEQYIRMPKYIDPFPIRFKSGEDQWKPQDDIVRVREVQYRRVRTDMDLNGLEIWAEMYL